MTIDSHAILAALKEHSQAANGKDPKDSGSESEDHDPESQEQDIIHEDHEPLEESIYGWAVSIVVRDVIWLNEGTALPMQRTARILNSILLIVCVIALQMFLLLAVSRLLSAPSVHTIRETYGKYEALMYPNHTTMTINGFPRGIPGYRVEENFKLMSPDEAKTVCQVPLSHPFYLISMLFIWTLTCQVELRAICESAIRMLWLTPTVKSTDAVRSDLGEQQEIKVEGLTRSMKSVIAVFVVVPRTVTLVALLYLGCRWLTATLGLGDVLLNALALEFLVLLKELLYNVCVSHRNRYHTQRLLIRPLRSVNSASFCTFFDAQVWGILSFLWAMVYVYHVQMVLPEYRWDLRDLCKKYIPAGPLF